MTDPTARLAAALAARHPHFMAPDLDRIRDLMDLLGEPQRSFPSVHITGTNGKTSTARMADALFRAAGLRTGRYTSPHLESVTDRISIDGSPVSAERLCQLHDELAPYFALVDSRHSEQVTFFELLTTLAFAAFADAPVEVAVVEVGLGGTWDATNVVAAPVAVITSIDLDHTDLLGHTTADIAAEKSGIIENDAIVVLSHQPPEALGVILDRVAKVHAHPVREGVDFAVVHRRLAVGGQLLTVRGLAGEYPDLLLPLHGAHQAHNAAAALAAAEAFLGGGGRPLDLETVRAGFAAADSPGRLEVVRSAPAVLLDAAHNPAGMRSLVAALGEAFRFRHLIAVLAILGDKDVAGMLELLEPVVDQVVVTANSSPRTLPADDLAALATEIFGAGRVHREEFLAGALERAVALAGAAEPGAGVVVTGSVVTVGEARTLLRATGR
ncbi:MAG: bifunctional folylpolyglutamate synthase/dihydrofolate synthase [Mycobacteriales bacterium]